MKARGFSLIELLISIAIILILLLAVGNAIIQTLHLQAFHAGRATVGRTATELSERLGEEARSSTAVFIPSLDVHGNPNAGASGSHEVDFFRRLSAGGDAFVAYDFDAATSNVTRYEYATASGTTKVLNADVAASGIASFAVVRERVADAGTIAGVGTPSEVTILYGSPQLAGGNDVILASFAAEGSGGLPGRQFSVHLAARAAPTALAILAPTGAPSSPPPTRVIPFVILRPGFPITPPHGPMHGGSPDEPSLIHWVAAVGSAQFLGSGPETAGNWFDLSAAYPRLTSGVYVFRNADGSSVTATISCVEGPCPIFHPAPVSAPAFTPSGTVAFQLAS